MDGRKLERPNLLVTASEYSWRALTVILFVSVILYVAVQFKTVVVPLLFAAIFSSLLLPGAKFLERKLRVKPIVSALVTVFFGFAGVIAALGSLGPSFTREINKLIPTIERGVNTLLTTLSEHEFFAGNEFIYNLQENTFEALGGVEFFTAAGTSLALGVLELLIEILLTLVLLFFFIKDREKIGTFVYRILPKQNKEKIRAGARKGHKILGKFIMGTSVVALIDAIGIGLGLWLLDVPLVLPLSVLVFFGGFIPVVGAVVTGALAVLVALAAGGLQLAFFVLLVVVAVQQIESNVLQPVVMRKAVSIHPIAVVVGIPAGAIAAGIIGAFLAVPIIAFTAAFVSGYKAEVSAET